MTQSESTQSFVSMFATSGARDRLRRAIGPGILMAGAAVGGSHLVASTQAGATFGWSLLGLLVLVNLFKYPFFLYGERYTAATGETILHGFRRMGKGYVLAYFALNLVNAFLNIAGVAMITASLSMNIGGAALGLALPGMTTLIAGICAAIIIWGRYRMLDGVIKLIILLLTVSTVTAVFAALANPSPMIEGFVHASPWNLTALGFIVLFMGWMPAPIDVAVWPSLWMRARESETHHRATMREAMFDFHLGYIATVVLAVFFLALGSLVIYGSGREFSMASAVFTNQLVRLYTDSIGEWAYWVIALAAFTTMFSTVLTCVDGYPRSLATCTVLLRDNETHVRLRKLHVFWIVLSVAATWLITTFFLQSLGQMLQMAMVISFLTSPVFAWIHFRVIRSAWVPVEYRPGAVLRALSYAGMAFFVGFTALFLWWFFFYTTA
jgi:Mn2+/Fe2+ NRAMP family transporter